MSPPGNGLISQFSPIGGPKSPATWYSICLANDHGIVEKWVNMPSVDDQPPRPQLPQGLLTALRKYLRQYPKDQPIKELLDVDILKAHLKSQGFSTLTADVIELGLQKLEDGRLISYVRSRVGGWDLTRVDRSA